MAKKRTTKSSKSTPASPAKYAVNYLGSVLMRIWAWLRANVTIRDVLYIAIAIIWAWLAITSYISMTTSLNVPSSREPHPIINANHGSDLDFVSALSTAVLPTVFGLLSLFIVVTLHNKLTRRIVLGLQVTTVALLFTWATATHIWTQSVVQSSVQPNPTEAVSRLACGDSIRTVDSYTYGAHTFYKLKDEGYKLAATYTSPYGTLDSDEDCAKYYTLRSQHPADSIVLQLFTYDGQHQAAPYLYKYAGQQNVANGIFVKE